jgi:hypothetical protein
MTKLHRGRLRQHRVRQVDEPLRHRRPKRSQAKRARGRGETRAHEQCGEEPPRHHPLSTSFPLLAHYLPLHDLASPVAAFVREECVLDPNREVTREDLWTAYKTWCDENGYKRPTKEILGRDLRAAFPSIQSKRPREGEARTRCYTGLRLKTANEKNASEEGGKPKRGPCARKCWIASDAPLVTGDGFPEEGVYLHDLCRQPWLDAHAPVKDKVDGVPFMMTHAMKEDLRRRGFSDEQIADMPPSEAHTILDNDPS